MLVKRRQFLRNLMGSLAVLAAWPKQSQAGKMAFPNVRNIAEPELWALVRQSFPLTKERTYFNTGGLGPSPYSVLEAIAEKRRELEAISETGHKYHEIVRKKVAQFVGADSEEIAFSRNATEGMNFIARGIPLKPGDEVLMTTHEHPGGAMPWLGVAKAKRIKVSLFEPENDPKKMIATVANHFGQRTKVLMFSHITCTLGTVFPAKELCQLARDNGIMSVIDGAQAVGQVPVNLHDIGCDFYTTSGHKWLLGPKESGFVYISSNARKQFLPSFVGAYSDKKYDLDQRYLAYRDDAIVNEYGTRDAAKIWGIGAAVEFMNSLGMPRVLNRLHDLAGKLKIRLNSLEKVEVLTPMERECSAGIVTFRIANMPYQKVARILGAKYRMRVRNVGEHHINATRVSLHIFNSKNEVEHLARAIEEIVKG